jgi:hypothetical protein
MLLKGFADKYDEAILETLLSLRLYGRDESTRIYAELYK